VRSNDGQGVSEIARGAGVSLKDAKKAVARLLSSGQLKKTGVRRGTKYHIGSGRAPARQAKRAKRGRRKARKARRTRAGKPAQVTSASAACDPATSAQVHVQRLSPGAPRERPRRSPFFDRSRECHARDRAPSPGDAAWEDCA
jgi:hypothetical protein